MSKAKILIVDDETEIVRSLAMRFTSNGYDVISASDGLQATNVALKEQPDLIILDIGMPAGDGHVVVKRLRDSIRTCNIPIIFLSARTADEDFKKAADKKVEKYITKPFKPEHLLAAVEELLGATQSQ